MRLATSSDEALLRRAVYAAWRWREPWDERVFAAHTEVGGADSYVDGFGLRPGDAGVVVVRQAQGEAMFAGAAWYRFFTHDDHREGFIGPQIPELVLAVMEHSRGVGLGRRLLEELLRHAEEQGVPALSLHVDRENLRARSLYTSLGFTVAEGGDERGMVLVRPVADQPSTRIPR